MNSIAASPPLASLHDEDFTAPPIPNGAIVTDQDLADAEKEFTIRTMICKFHPEAMTAAELRMSYIRKVAVEMTAANQTFPQPQGLVADLNAILQPLTVAVQGLEAGQNANLQAIQALLNGQETLLQAIQGLEAGQNTNFQTVQALVAGQNANLQAIQGLGGQMDNLGVKMDTLMVQMDNLGAELRARLSNIAKRHHNMANENAWLPLKVESPQDRAEDHPDLPNNPNAGGIGSIPDGQPANFSSRGHIQSSGLALW